MSAFWTAGEGVGPRALPPSFHNLIIWPKPHNLIVAHNLIEGSRDEVFRHNLITMWKPHNSAQQCRNRGRGEGCENIPHERAERSFVPGELEKT